MNPRPAWSSMARARDFAAHRYYTLDRDLLWQTVSESVRDSAATIQDMLRAVSGVRE